MKKTTILSVAELIEILQQFPPNAVPFVLHYGKDHGHGIVKEDMMLGVYPPYCPNDSLDPVYDLGIEIADGEFAYDRPFLMICGI